VTRPTRRTVIAAVCLAATGLAQIPPAFAGVGEGTATPSFSESWGCGQPSTSGALVEHSGWLADSEPIRGYRGDFFGRTVGEIRDHLVDWTVPMSDGFTVKVHQRALPAFQQVTANLAAEEAAGHYYQVRDTSTYGFAPRTIAGTSSLSLHAFGAAVDINATTNPYRSDGVLVSDMPQWFIDAWKAAGFCWGGDWYWTKDPMHFSWMGPGATPGYGEVPQAFAPRTQAAGFATEAYRSDTPFGAADPDADYLIGDGNGNGLADVFTLVAQEGGLRLEYSRTNQGNAWCSVARNFAPGAAVDGRIPLLGDYSQVGRNDLWLLDPTSGTLQIEVLLKPSDFDESAVIATSIPTDPSDVYLLGDHDRDGAVDLYVIRNPAGHTSVEVWNGADDFATRLLDVATPLTDTAGWQFTLGDTDLDGLPDLFAITSDGASTDVTVLANGYAETLATYHLAGGGGYVDVAVNDFDGDGRGDLFLFDTSGELSVRLGDVPLAGVGLTTWQRTASWECDPDSPPYVFDGTFRDDDGNVHEQAIETIAATGITVGCNPPYNDDYCPRRNVTRGEMAALLVRALGLSDDGGRDWFGDDDESIFEADINRLAAAGITVGCNPPANDAYCPDADLTRGEMAALLVRALGLSDDGGRDWFGDDDHSVFERDIDRLAAAGITYGCNPPANTRFCVERTLTRDETASFLARSLPFLP
jgi:hypothetical protein